MVTLDTRDGGRRDGSSSSWPRRSPPPRWPWLVGLLLGLGCVLIVLAFVNAVLRLT